MKKYPTEHPGFQTNIFKKFEDDPSIEPTEEEVLQGNIFRIKISAGIFVLNILILIILINSPPPETFHEYFIKLFPFMR